MRARLALIVGTACGALALALPLGAASLRVSEGSQIQHTIDSATYGDSVWVAPGKYDIYPLRMRNGITLLAEGSAEETILRNGQFSVIQAEDLDSLTVVEGFTLDGVKAAEGVLSAENSRLTVRNCIVKNGWSGVRSMYGDVRVEECRIHDCQNGVYFYESGGSILGNDIQRCIRGINIVSSNPRIVRNMIARNSVGIAVSKHSDPSIGGSIATANRIYENPGGNIFNQAYLKRFSIRTMEPMTLKVSFNYWGSDCPDTSKFRGLVEWSPWVDETGTRSLESCPSSTSD